MHTKTLKVRVKDRHAADLMRQARAVNFVWNYINELSSRAIRERRLFFSAYDIHEYTAGTSKELGLHAHTIQRVAMEYVTRRKQHKKAKLSWRKSFGTRRSLGWIPINTDDSKWKNGQVYFNRKYYKVWDSYGLANYKFRTASFNEDARGRWYFNVVVYVPETVCGTGEVGIDLGLNNVATCSDGRMLESGRFYRDQEARLGQAQRANKKARVRAIHALIKNRRKDALHKFSSNLVKRCGLIVVGNVSPSDLAKTKHAKAVLDCAWFFLKTLLAYKCAHAGGVFLEVNEAYTTQTCSRCGRIGDSSPKGRTGLRIREWTCSGCGAAHQRDVNAAKNILALGHQRLAGGIPALKGGEDVKVPI